LYVMTGWVGLVGAGISYAIYQSVWAMLMGWTVRRSFAESW
jgi:hypothetical protein